MEGKEELPNAEEALPYWSGCFAGDAVMEASGGVMAHGRHLQVAVLLFQPMEREFTTLPLSSSVSFFFLFFRCQVVSLFVLLALLFISLSNPPLFQTRLLSSLSIYPVFFPFLFLSFSFFILVLVLRAVFIGKRGAGVTRPKD